MAGAQYPGWQKYERINNTLIKYKYPEIDIIYTKILVPPCQKEIKNSHILENEVEKFPTYNIFKGADEQNFAYNSLFQVRRKGGTSKEIPEERYKTETSIKLELDNKNKLNLTLSDLRKITNEKTNKKGGFGEIYLLDKSEAFNQIKETNKIEKSVKSNMIIKKIRTGRKFDQYDHNFIELCYLIDFSIRTPGSRSPIYKNHWLVQESSDQDEQDSGFFLYLAIEEFDLILEDLINRIHGHGNVLNKSELGTNNASEVQVANIFPIILIKMIIYQFFVSGILHNDLKPSNIGFKVTCCSKDPNQKKSLDCYCFDFGSYNYELIIEEEGLRSKYPVTYTYLSPNKLILNDDDDDLKGIDMNMNTSATFSIRQSIYGKDTQGGICLAGFAGGSVDNYWAICITILECIYVHACRCFFFYFKTLYFF